MGGQTVIDAEGQHLLRAWYQCCLQPRWLAAQTRRVHQHRPKSDCYRLHACLGGAIELHSYKYRCELAAGHFAILPPSYGFRHRHEEHSSCVQHWELGFAVLPLPGTIDLLAHAPLPLIEPLPAAFAAADTWHELAAIAADRSAAGLRWRLHVRAALDALTTTAVLAWAQRRPAISTPAGFAPEWLQAAYHAIQQSYMKADFSLQQIAHEVGISLSRFQHAFTQCYGMPPASLARHLRMQHARHLLSSNPELSVQEIARRCGFRSAAAFSTAFRRHHGASPQALRR